MAKLVKPTFPLTIFGVKGYNDRHNDLVYSAPTTKGNVQQLVVYFGGDMQDFANNMQKRRECQKYLQWSLEDTARVLQDKFPGSHVLVVRPSRIEQSTFSCYRNFVPCNNFGVPEHIAMNFALLHLHLLVQHLNQRLKVILADDNCGFRIDEYKNLQLIGFSKGCVVLNQIIHEFHHLQTMSVGGSDVLEFASRIKNMHWLDGGHSGNKDTWITSRPLLEAFAKLGINIHVHVTPYQIRDNQRPHIRKEEEVFTRTLREHGAGITRTFYFDDQSPNLKMHFSILNVFKVLY